MSYIKVDIKAKSINQLRRENPELFWKSQAWYDKEKFATTKPKAETLWINPQIAESTDKTYDEQLLLLDPTAGGSVVPTANQLIQCLIQHYKATGERLLEETYSRTSDVYSDGYRVNVGSFDADGLDVSNDWAVDRRSGLGLASSRKSAGASSLEVLDPVVPLTIELKINGKKYRVVEDD